MQIVKLDRNELLQKVITNRNNHRKVFEEAIVGFREELIKHLDHMIADAKAGKKVTLYISLPEPQDQTSDYDRVIMMLEMSKDTEITLTAKEFSSYVMDRWDWKQSFGDTASNYAKSDFAASYLSNK